MDLVASDVVVKKKEQKKSCDDLRLEHGRYHTVPIVLVFI